MAIDALDRIAFSTVAITTTAIEEVAGTDLTFLGWRVLVVLGETSSPMRVGDLGLRLNLSRASASKLVRRLQKRGWIVLAPDEADRRGTLVSLAARGAQLRHDVLTRRREILAEALAAPLPSRFDTGLDVVARRLERWM
jgi:DNA-binding MarR family transcriptional regulator